MTRLSIRRSIRPSRRAALAAMLTVAVPVLLLWNRVPPVVAGAPPALVLRPADAVAAGGGRRLFAGGLDDPSVAEVVAGDAGDVPVLVGVVGRLPDAVALVRGDDGRSRAVAVGGTAGDWRLEGLAADRAVFARGAERVRVRLAAD